MVFGGPLAEQSFRDLSQFGRLFAKRKACEPRRNYRGVEGCGEDKWDIAALKLVSDRKYEIAFQVNIQDCCVDLLILDEIQSGGHTSDRTDNCGASFLKLPACLIRQKYSSSTISTRFPAKSSMAKFSKSSLLCPIVTGWYIDGIGDEW